MHNNTLTRHLLISAFAGILLLCSVRLTFSEIARGTHGYKGDMAAVLKLLEELNANAVWIEAIGRSFNITKADIEAIHKKGMKAIASTIAYDYRFWNEGKTGLKYPFCLSGQYRQDWANIYMELAAMAPDGIVIVPNELSWNSGHIGYEFGMYWVEACKPFLQEQRKKWKYPYSDAFEKEMWAKYHKKPVQDESSPDFRYFMLARYQSATDAVRYWNECVKKVNPNIKTTSLFTSIFAADNRYAVGTAWDMIGQTGIDSLGANPYVLLHDDRGIPSHYYPTVTAIHLASANKNKVCDVKIEASRLREELREIKPVEVYGCALSSVAHGARGIFYFTHDILMAKKLPLNPENNKRWIRNAFDIIQDIDPWVEGACIPKDIAVLYSRAGDDFYQLLLKGKDRSLLHRSGGYGYRYPFLAQREVLYSLLENGYPFDMHFLDQLNYDDIKDCRLIVIPFGFSIPKDKVDMLEKAVREGANLLVISEYGSVNETGDEYKQGALLELLGLESVSRKEVDAPIEFAADSPVLPGEKFGGAKFSVYDEIKLKTGTKLLTGSQDKGRGITLRELGKGKALFLGGEFGIRTQMLPGLFSFAGEFDKVAGCIVTDSPWEKIAIYESPEAYIETGIGLSGLTDEYKMTIVVTGGKDAKAGDHFTAAINGDSVWEIPLTNGWKKLDNTIKIKQSDLYRLKISLAGSKGAAVHKLFFTPMVNRDKKRHEIVPAADRRYSTVFTGCVDYLLNNRRPLTLKKSCYEDIEATVLEKPDGERAVFLINWDDFTTKFAIGLDVPPGQYEITERNLVGMTRFVAGEKKVFSEKDLQALAIALKPEEVKVLRVTCGKEVAPNTLSAPVLPGAAK